MKTNRETLEKHLISMLPEILSDKQKREFFKDYMLKKDINPGLTQRILNDPNQVLTITDLYLCVVTIALQKTLQETENEDQRIKPINPEDYFNPAEIEKANEYKEKTEEFNCNYIEFNNVTQIASNQYICPFESCKKLIQYINNALVRYNFKTQRGSTKAIFNDKIIELPTINKTAVKEIKQKILDNLFTQNMITFNIFRNGHEKFEYKGKTLTIEIGEQSYFDIIDGYHRLLAAMSALSKKPELQFGFVINILNYTEDEAQNYIVQEDKRTPISKEILAAYDKQDTNVLLTNEINKYGTEKTNALYGKITNTIEDGGLTTTQIFSQAIELLFKIDTPADTMKIKKYLVDFFNQVSAIFLNDFENIQQSRKNNYRLFPNSFIGYLGIASILFDKDNWEEKLKNILEKIDLNFSKRKLKEIGIEQKKINKPLIKRICKYFLKESGLNV